MNGFYYNSPAGLLRIEVTGQGISAVGFVKDERGHLASSHCDNPFIKTCISQLDDYFAGKCETFDLPLDPAGTDFQKTVWNELMKIPFGKTVSYLYIAKALGDPNKIRAVGGANGKNPIAIIGPCHRVIGSDGSLTGYAGGIDKKRWLLGFEGSISGEIFEW
jgi:methylated-DNA-[protein]-cysteine S-methyltransferase